MSNHQETTAAEWEDEMTYCTNCDTPLDENEHIFCFSRGDEDKTMCQMCGEDTHEEMKADGWRRDDEDE
jgi:RNase P subunit RPR2